MNLCLMIYYLELSDTGASFGAPLRLYYYKALTKSPIDIPDKEQ